MLASVCVCVCYFIFSAELFTVYFGWIDKAYNIIIIAYNVYYVRAVRPAESIIPSTRTLLFKPMDIILSSCYNTVRTGLVDDSRESTLVVGGGWLKIESVILTVTVSTESFGRTKKKCLQIVITYYYCYYFGCQNVVSWSTIHRTTMIWFSTIKDCRWSGCLTQVTYYMRWFRWAFIKWELQLG